MRASGGQNVVISREEMHGMFTGVPGGVDRDVVAFTTRIDAAIARLAGLERVRTGGRTLPGPGCTGLSRSNCAPLPGITMIGPLTSCSAPFSK